MSRSSKSFRQLMNYLDKEDSLNRFSWNMYADAYSNRELIKEFMENAKYLDKSRGRVYLYHEVLSLENVALDSQRASELLYDLANSYVDRRAKNQMVFAVVHQDSNNPHLHLVISANEVSGNKRVRLSKKELSSIQASLETYKNRHYASELGESYRYGKAKDRSKSTRKEQEMKSHRETLSQKEQIKADLEDIFIRATTRKAMENALRFKSYRLYSKGNSTGVIYDSKKYRLKTLGLDKIYENTVKHFNAREKIRARREKLKVEKSNTHEQSYSR